MDGKTHAAIGAAASLVALQPTEPTQIVVTAAIGAFSGLLPDIDLAQSKGSQIMKKVTLTFIIILAGFVLYSKAKRVSLEESLMMSGVTTTIFGLALLIAFYFYGSTQPHRGFTHSLIGCGAALFIGYLLFGMSVPFKAFCIGYVFHILADMFNTVGMQFFWPREGRYCFGLCKSNGAVALTLRTCACVLAVGYVVYLSWRL